MEEPLNPQNKYFLTRSKAEGLNLFPVLNSSLATFHVKYQTFQYHSEESTVAPPV